MRIGGEDAFAAALRAIDNEHLDMDDDLWEDLTSVDAVLGEWHATANWARLNRELDEKYGPFRDIVLHPYCQWLIRLADEELRDLDWIGGPITGLTTIAVVGFTLYRAKISTVWMALVMAFLFQVHPILIVTGFGAFAVWRDRARKPLGLFARRPLKVPTGPAPIGEGLGGEAFDDYLTAERAAALQKEAWDHVVVGSGAGALHTAVTLARLGRKVLVLEPGSSLGPDLRRRDAASGADVDVAVPTVSTVDFHHRLLAPCAPAAARWVPLGSAKNGHTHTVVYPRGAGGEALMLRPGRETLVNDVTMLHPTLRRAIEGLVAQVEQSGNGAWASFLLKALPPWARRTSAFDGGQAEAFRNVAANTVGNALTRILAPPAGGEEKSGDGDADPQPQADASARALLGALFHTEGVPADVLSVAPFVLSIRRALRGLYTLAPSADTVHPPASAMVRELVASLRKLGGAAVTLTPPMQGGASAPARAAWELTALSSEGKHKVCGVNGEGGGRKFSFRCAHEVISGVGMTETLHRLPAAVDVEAAGPGLGKLLTQRPRARVHLNLKLRTPATRLPRCAIVNAAYAESLDIQRQTEGFWRVEFPPCGRGAPAAAAVELELCDNMLSLEQRSGCPRLPRPNLNGTVRAALVKRATRVLHEAVGDLLPQDGSGVVDARVYAREGYSALYNTVTRYISPAVRPNPFDAPETDAEEAAPKAVPAPAAPAKDGEAAAAVGDKAAPLPAAAAASSSVSGLVFTGSDLAMDGFDGDLSGSYLCLNYLAGYGPLEVFVQGRDIVKDLAQWS